MSAFASGSRFIKLLLVAVAAGALALSASYAWQAWFSKLQSDKDLVLLENQVQDYERLQAELNSYSSYREGRIGLAADMKRNHMVEDRWESRRVQIDHKVLERSSVQDYLNSLNKGHGVVFVPEKFQLMTIHSKDSLFQWKSGDSKEIALTLVGRYYMRK